MQLMDILVGTLLCGVGSVVVAWFLTKALLSRFQQHMLSLAAGALLATAFLHLLPEAFMVGASAQDLFITLLVGLVFFFLLDKAELWHHGHEHAHGQGHSHAHSLGTEDGVGVHEAHLAHEHVHEERFRSGAWSVLLGDSIHAFGDGMLVAGAFLANTSLGWAASAAVLAHEIPHHMGDLVVLSQNNKGNSQALIKLILTGAVTVFGGVVAYEVLRERVFLEPFILCVASSSYLYVALADLIPQLQKRLDARQTMAQVAWLFMGMLWVQVSIAFLA